MRRSKSQVKISVDGESACRRDSVQAPEGGPGGHPSERPTWGAPSLEDRTSSPSPTLGLAPGGVYRAIEVALDAGALLPHPFTLTCAGPEGPPSAVSFLWHCPAGHPDWPLASTLLCGVPTFLDTVPRTVRAAATWPTHRRAQSATAPRARVTAQHVDRVSRMSGGTHQLFDPEAPPLAAAELAAEEMADPGVATEPDRQAESGGAESAGPASAKPQRSPHDRQPLRGGRGRAGPRLPPEPAAVGAWRDPACLGPPVGPSLPGPGGPRGRTASPGPGPAGASPPST